MDICESTVYISPFDRSALSVTVEERKDGKVLRGFYKDESGHSYQIRDGVPLFFDPECLAEEEKTSIGDYDKMASYYDKWIDWLFQSVYENERDVRNRMIDLLDITSDSTVLDVGCGTGRDSSYIAPRLGSQGSLYLLDISEKMIQISKSRLHSEPQDCQIRYLVASANMLPFPDGYFDAIYSFGGFNEFPNPSLAMREFARVVKAGGKIVVGDENIAPWLENSEYANIIKTNNPIFNRTSIPLGSIPDIAEEVTLRWIIGQCFYLVDFRIGDTPPRLNMDLHHEGWRGGTMRTRYFGQLEGVDPETKEKVIAAAKHAGVSVYKWLNSNLTELADNELNG